MLLKRMSISAINIMPVHDIGIFSRDLSHHYVLPRRVGVCAGSPRRFIDLRARRTNDGDKIGHTRYRLLNTFEIRGIWEITDEAARDIVRWDSIEYSRRDASVSRLVMAINVRD